MTATAVHNRVTEARDRLRVPALGAAVLDGDGRLECHVTGVRRRGGSDPAAATDRWHIGSCGKAFTAALYARLVEAGRADWSVSIKDLFGDLEVRSGWAAVTIDDLLMHRAGVQANIGFRTMLAYFCDQRPVADQRTEVAAAELARPPVGAGTFRYSNLGYTLAGAAIERIAGEPYETALNTHLLAPLGISSAGFGPPPELWGHQGRLRLGSLILGRGKAVEPNYRYADNPVLMTPAGRLHITIADWSRFVRLFLASDGTGLLVPASIERLLTVRSNASYAMGWGRAQGSDTVSFMHQGSNTNWVATVVLDADRRRAAMVIANDGRTAILARTVRLAVEVLRDSPQ